MNATINYYNVIVNFCARKLVLCCRHDHVPQHGLLFLLLFLQAAHTAVNDVGNHRLLDLCSCCALSTNRGVRR